MRRPNRVWFVTLVEFFPEKFAKFQSNWQSATKRIRRVPPSK